MAWEKSIWTESIFFGTKFSKDFTNSALPFLWTTAKVKNKGEYSISSARILNSQQIEAGLVRIIASVFWSKLAIIFWILSMEESPEYLIWCLKTFDLLGSGWSFQILSTGLYSTPFNTIPLLLSNFSNAIAFEDGKR